jgi:hypothetical protein
MLLIRVYVLVSSTPLWQQVCDIADDVKKHVQQAAAAAPAEN